MIYLQNTWHSICHPSSPFYYPVQTVVMLNVVYLSTYFLSSLSPCHSVFFILTAIVVDRVANCVLVRLFEPHARLPLIPSLGYLVQKTFSIRTAKLCCQKIGYSTTLNKIFQIGFFYLIAYYVTQSLYEKSLSNQSAYSPIILTL